MKTLKNFLPKPNKKNVYLAAILALAGMALQASADDMDDAFNSASGVANQQKNQGSNTLSQGNVTDSVPAATSNPKESGYYGGVTGGSSALDSAKESVPQNNEAYQAVSSADKSNPPPKIDPNADFIQNGVNAEANSPTTYNGTNSHCTSTVVSKSVFQNYSCERDLAVEQTCARTGSIQVTGSRETYTTQFTMDARNSSGNNEANYWIRYDFTAPDDGTLSSGTWEFSYPRAPSYHGDRLGYSFHALGNSITTNYNNSGTFSISPQHVSKGQVVSLYVHYDTDGHYDEGRDGLKNSLSNGRLVLRVTLPMAAERDTTTSQIVWNESCPFDKSQATAQTGTVCTDPGGTRTVHQNGRDYSQTADCWQYSDSYIVPVTSSGNCSELEGNRNCTVSGRGCTDSQNGTCMHEQDNYQCQVTYTSEGQVCGGNYFCVSGDCGNTQPNGNNEFGQLVAELAAVAAAGDDTKKTAPDVRIFTGKAVSCRKAMAGFSNCCVDKGWGADVGLAHCDSEEKAIGVAKEKKVIIKVGTYCGTRVLGVCVQKKEGYCQFEGKLAKIFQEQGRLKQLNISFGDASSPDCRGMTVDELQRINFDIIDYSDFYSEVQGNVQLPENQETIDRIKAKINTQVGNMGGAK